MPLFERLTVGWVDDNVGLFFLLDKVAERGDITRLGAGLPTVVGRRTGKRPQVIAQLQNWVVMVGFDDGRCCCWAGPLVHGTAQTGHRMLTELHRSVNILCTC